MNENNPKKSSRPSAPLTFDEVLLLLKTAIDKRASEIEEKEEA